MDEFRMVPGLPKLAWIADVTARGLVVHHGPWVEGEQGWFSEGVWDDDFTSAGLAGARYLFGSGAVMDSDTAHFFTPTHMVERLLVADTDGHVVVSNSVPLIIAVMDSDLIDGHDYEEYNAITAGLSEYNPIMNHPGFSGDSIPWLPQYRSRLAQASRDLRTRPVECRQSARAAGGC